MIENKSRLVKNWNISGRRVDFTQKLPLAWGIEVDLPLDNEERQRIYKRLKIELPDRITKFKFLDLNPQESLPPNLRNSGNDEWNRTNLEDLVVSGRGSLWADTKRRRMIEKLFYWVFGKNAKPTNKFNSLINKSNGDTILFVEGHAWDIPFKIGEQTDDHVRDINVANVQKWRNESPVREILKRYNNPQIYSSIIIFACYNGKRKIRAIDVPLVYNVGHAGDEKWLKKGLTQTIVTGPV